MKLALKRESDGEKIDITHKDIGQKFRVGGFVSEFTIDGKTYTNISSQGWNMVRYQSDMEFLDKLGFEIILPKEKRHAVNKR